MLRAQTLLSLLWLAACGANELNASTNATTQEQPVTPLGTVSGQVLTTGLEPLEGAKVRLTAGASTRSATTDADGAFSFTDVPAGSDVLVSVEKEGFASAHTTVWVPSSAGQFPLADGNARVGPVVLSALDGSLQFLVQDNVGRPAAKASARLEASPTAIVHNGDALSQFVTEAEVDATGVLRFTDVPSPFELATLGGTYHLLIEPVDLDGDGFPDLNGRAVNLSAWDLVANAAIRSIVLAPVSSSTGSFGVIAGNVGSVFGRKHPTDNLVAPGEALRFVFSEPLDPDSALVRLTDEYGLEELSVTLSVEGAGRTLVAKPAQTLPVGAEFNLHMRVNSRAGELFTRTGFFFTGQRGSPKDVKIAAIRYQETTTELPSRLNQGETVYVEFDQPIALTGSDNQPVELFFATDINGSNVVGDEVGEIGNPARRGIPLAMSEPTGPIESLHPDRKPVFPLVESGYSTRFVFRYDGVTTLDPGLVSLRIDFDLLRERTADVYETVWGTPVQGALESGLKGLPPPPEDD